MFHQYLPSRRKVGRIILPLAAVFVLASCSDKPADGGAPGGMKVPVSVITVEPSRAEMFADLPGRVEAIRDAQIRARVTGIVTGIHFEQGSDVKEGQLLFTIDPAPYKAARDQAAAMLKQAQADAGAARTLSKRYETLIKANAVSRQDYDNAVARTAQADAAIASAKAALQAADIDLGYTKITSPIDGRIGKSLVTEGALVSASSATQLATVQQLDRVYVDSMRSTAELAQLRKAIADGTLKQAGDGAAQALALMDGGELYAEPGRLLFSGVSVDPTTGQVVLRSEFPNPDKILLPGMYVRVRLQQGIDEKALMVPQQALQRTADGRSSLMLVKDGKVAVSPVLTGPSMNGKVVVTSGLQAGDAVIVEGFQKIRPGAPVQPMPWKADGAQQQPKPDQPQGGEQPAGQAG
ncbi:efflux RND transporter periplasmic adaptor subunit [Paracandidimonas soli]|uniref:efflux RND transporter periplasmic adaptor subunit n=1 Tax=Paracandidimonas soli TaxID=1917182 RepID=UPI0033419057